MDSSIITAAAGIIGVLTGTIAVSLKELVVSRFKRKKDAAYLAIIVVSQLDRYAAACLDIAYDDGEVEGRPAGGDGSYWQTTIDPPTFDPWAINVEWKALSPNLMYAVLRLPDRQRQLQRRLIGTHQEDDYPEFAEYFFARRHGYAVLGLEVEEAALSLRRHTNMPIEKLEPGEQSRGVRLRNVRDQMTEERAAYLKRLAEYRTTTSLPTAAL